MKEKRHKEVLREERDINAGRAAIARVEAVLPGFPSLFF